MIKHLHKAFTLIRRKGFTLIMPVETDRKAKRAAFTLIMPVETDRKAKRAAFTLIEVLVAGSVLFVVSAAVVGLSNSIIQGTSVTTDAATANRLATQGLELVTKIRDDNIKVGGFSQTGEFIWFEAVENPDNYGWWQLSENPSVSDEWELTADQDFDNVVDLTDTDFDPDTTAEALTVDQITFYRLICIEALAAENDQEEDRLTCNTVDTAAGHLPVIDGTRNDTSACYSQPVGATLNEDIYCQFTDESLNRNRVIKDKIIPDGNAVKIRSVVIWQDKDIYRQSEVSTLLTNWQSFVQ